MSLKAKILTVTLSLVVFSVVLISAVSYYELSSFSKESIETSQAALVSQINDTLKTGVRTDAQVLRALVDRTEQNAHQLAGSANLQGYISAKVGQNEIINDIAAREVTRIVEGIASTCRAQKAVLQKKLDADLKMAVRILSGRGTVSVSKDRTVEWKAVNQFTKASQALTLPEMSVGTDVMRPNDSFSKPSPVVDEVESLTGSTCTVFQRMNEAGDMLRVVTNVRKADGARAIGTYIPARQPDGSANPVVASVMKGNVFRGVAFVVDGWYVAAYEPIKYAGGKIIGMIYVGVSQRDLTQTIREATIGKSGYVFVSDSKGSLLVHPKSELVGKNVITDLRLDPFKEVLKNRAAGKTQIVNYSFEGRSKLACYTYFEDWDWIVCASAYWDDLSSSAAENCLKLLRGDIESLYKVSFIDTTNGKRPMYAQIRFVDEQGMEAVNLKSGAFADKLVSKADTDWFAATKALKAGQTYNSGVVIAANTGEPEMRIAVPVHIRNEFKGATVLSLDWGLAWDQLKGKTYGKTGYVYVVNDRGFLVCHPKYTLKDNMNMTDAKYGSLAAMVRERMLRGDHDATRYEFEGISKVASYCPLRIGDKTYSVAATCPEAELMESVNALRAQADRKAKLLLMMVGGAAVILMVLGSLVSWVFSRRLTQALLGVIQGLDGGANQVNTAAEQVSSSSRQLAEGASEQASSLEETSSALEEMAGMSRQNADNSREANRYMAEAQGVIHEAGTVMGETSNAMQSIAEASEKIQKIIKVIEEIAFQTNLLALNAAVEAARAGEHGKGFAVVADEVRNLSQRAAQAARETGDLIEQTVNRVQRGVELNATTNSAFVRIGESANKVADLVAQIARASNEQAKGVEQVNAAVAQMDRVTQSNAASAEESSSAAEQLTSEAHNVRQMVNDLVIIVGAHSTKSGS